MGHNNLPDDVTSSMIPGNRPEDVRADQAAEWAEKKLGGLNSSAIESRIHWLNEIVEDSCSPIRIALLKALGSATPYALNLVLDRHKRALASARIRGDEENSENPEDHAAGNAALARLMRALEEAYDWSIEQEAERILEREE